MDSLEMMLREITGFDDAADFLVALKTMPPDSVTAYLNDAFGENELNGAVARALGGEAPMVDGMVVYRKKEEVDDGRTAKRAAVKPEREKGRVPGGGITAVVHEKKKGRQAKSKGATNLDSLNSVLRPGRHPCSCNGRRFKLLYNCLSCGKVICEQEGEGPCLFCGADPHSTAPLASSGDEGAAAASAAEATRRKERLLEFDRSAAKRTTVIDDQVLAVVAQ